MLTPRGWVACSLTGDGDDGDGSPGAVPARARREGAIGVVVLVVVVMVAVVGSRSTRSIRTKMCFPVLRSTTSVCMRYPNIVLVVVASEED